MPTQRRSTQTVPVRTVKRASKSSRNGRKKRRDMGTIRFSQRDRFALLWIGHQYGVQLDHLQWLLGRDAGRGATFSSWISESAARDVVDRWERAGWIRVARLQVNRPFWIWLTRKGLRLLDLPYAYRNLTAASGDDLKSLSALNAIRLDQESYQSDIRWTSERALMRGQVRLKGSHVLHRPDGIITFPDGDMIAIEAELSSKKPFELEEIFLELLRGEAYLQAKKDLGLAVARALCRHDHSQYEAIWYFAPPAIRKVLRRTLKRLLTEGVIREEEADRLYVYWYPLAITEEEMAQEEQEDDEARS